nr:MAG TPA: hypothetical protein [Caudoviricetes sp.]
MTKRTAWIGLIIYATAFWIAFAVMLWMITR